MKKIAFMTLLITATVLFTLLLFRCGSGSESARIAGGVCPCGFNASSDSGAASAYRRSFGAHACCEA